MADDKENTPGRFFIALCWIQGLYFFVTGVWPLVHIDSFIVITGPKTDLWLVRTVGTQIAVVSIVLLYAGITRRIDSRLKLLAVGSSAGFAVIDILYGGVKDRISNVYLADAVVQLLLIAAWVIAVVNDHFKLKDRNTYV